MPKKQQLILTWSTVIMINIIPVFIWLFLAPLPVRFANTFNTFTSLGQVFGLVGLSLMATVIILAGRLKFLEKYFYGLDKIYQHHHFLGGLAFILILFHPLWLAVRYVILAGSKSAALFLLPNLSELPKTLGILSLTLMIIFLALTFYFSLKYHIWKFTHKFLGIVFVLAFLHALLIPSDISRNVILRSYMVGLASVAFMAYTYRVLLPAILVKKYTYEVVGVKKLTDGVTEITMMPKGKAMNFQSGQFAFYSFRQKGLNRETHPFSFSSAPEDNGQIQISFKNLGDYTAILRDKLQVGAKVKVEGPFGFFVGGGEKQIWIAGGIGVTPFLSMLKNLPSRAKVDFYWSVKNAAEMFDTEVLQRAVGANNNFKFFPHVSETDGRLSVEIIKKQSGIYIDSEIFLCGPPAMMNALKSQFIKLGVAKSNIHSEEFSLW